MATSQRVECAKSRSIAGVADQFETLTPTGEGANEASELVAQLNLGAPATGDRPRLVAAMIASADGRAAVDGRAGGLGSPPDRAILRELRCAMDAVLVGPTTLIEERYSSLLDDEHRERRLSSGRPAEPITATISRKLDPRLEELNLFATPDQPIVIYTESANEMTSHGADIQVQRLEPGQLSLAGCLEDLHANHGVQTLLSEGGPTLLRALVSEGLVDDFVFTVSPLLVSGSGTNLISGDTFDPPVGLDLQNVWKSQNFLFLHYTRQR